MIFAVTDDYFGTGGGSLPPTIPPQGWQAPVGTTVRPPATASVTVSAPTLAGIGGVVAALMMCLGAWAPWLHVGSLGIGLDFSGLHSHLDGRYIMILGFVALMLSAGLLVLPRDHAIRTAAVAVLTLIGVVGLVLVVHEYVVLSDRASDINQAIGLSGVGNLLDIHVQSGWGLWLAGLGCAGASAAGVAAYLL
jgi:hypothetical protein